MLTQASESTTVSDAGVRHTGAVDDTQAVTMAAAVQSERRDYRVYKPIGTARTWAGRKTIYYSAGDEAMYAVVNRYLRAINWIQLISWINDTAAEQQYQFSYSTGLTITQGREINNGFSLGASYQGMSVGVEHSTRTFKNTETTSTQTTAISIHVPPKSQLIFYQKRYDFEDNITFINDAWGRQWNIGPWGGYDPLTTKVTTVQIMAEEYYTRSSPLPEGPGSVHVDSVPAAETAGWNRKRENVTRRAKKQLNDMGL